MKKIKQEQAKSNKNQYQRGSIDFSNFMTSLRTADHSSFLVLESKDKSDTAVGLWGIARRDDYSLFQASSSKVRLMHSFADEAARTRCRPSKVFFGVSLNAEGEPSLKINCRRPTDFANSDWIVDFYSMGREYYFWSNDENPRYNSCGDSIRRTNYSFGLESRHQEGCSCTAPEQGNNDEISPNASGSIGVGLLHSDKTTSSMFAGHLKLMMKGFF